jgi:exopolyphosphatase/guanosine-5'-triphosphate,3'-diphosphate pyrophosphatase
MTRNVAAIDIGSNSTNLLVTDEHGAQLVREVNVTALGEGVARTNVLSPAAIERTLAVIRRYAAVVAQHNAELHITGTAACRMASNTRDFFAQVRTATGVGPRLLSAADEARLAWHGAVASLPATDGDTMVIDIGGASTELTVGTLPGVPAQSSVQSSALTSVSLPFGVVTLTEAELHSDPPRAEELSNAVSMVGDAVDNAAIEYPQLAGAQRVVGVACSSLTLHGCTAWCSPRAPPKTSFAHWPPNDSPIGCIIRGFQWNAPASSWEDVACWLPSCDDFTLTTSS